MALLTLRGISYPASLKSAVKRRMVPPLTSTLLVRIRGFSQAPDAEALSGAGSAASHSGRRAAHSFLAIL